MTIDTTTIDALAARLRTGDDRPLSTDERALVSAALRELAAAQLIIARQSMLLGSYADDHAAMESAAHSAINELERAASEDPESLDRAALEARRAMLLREIQSASRIGDVTGAVLRFVAALLA